MTTFAVCVPWRGGNPSRESLWERVRQGLVAEGFTFYAADSDPDRPFNICQARNRAADMAGDVDVLVFCDADTFIPPAQVREAVRLASEDGSLVQPYTRFLSMHPITGETRSRISKTAIVNSGNLAIARTLYERTGGWDERFDTWGWEDAAFMGVARELGPFHAVQGTIIAFEHTRLPHETVEGAVRPAAVLDTYIRSRGIEDIVRDIRAARRPAPERG